MSNKDSIDELIDSVKVVKFDSKLTFFFVLSKDVSIRNNKFE